MSGTVAAWPFVHVTLSAALYRKAAKKVRLTAKDAAAPDGVAKAGTLSFNAYVVSLICRDLGVDFGSIDYQPNWRSWNVSRPPSYPPRIHLPPTVNTALRAKVEALPYPVPLSAYVRRLIEQDVAQSD